MKRVVPWCGLVLAGAAVVWAQPIIERIKVQELETVEKVDTVLERGEIVAVFDEVDNAAVLRVGDGETPAGLPVVDPAAARATRRRLLRSDEYAIVPSGLAAITNGEWRLLPDRMTAVLDNERWGAVEIVAAVPLAEVSYDTDVSNAGVAQTPATAEFGAETTNVMLRAHETEAPTPIAMPVRAAVSNLAVWAWTEPLLVGATNDLRLATTLVRGVAEGVALSSLAANEPVSRGAFDAAMDGRWGDDWAEHRASADVRLNWRTLHLNPYISMSATSRGVVWADRDGSNILRVVRARQTYEIVAYTLTSSNVTLWVEDGAEFAGTPWIETCSNLVGGVWVPLETTTTWPTSEWVTGASGARYQAYRLEAAVSAPAFFRAVAPGLLEADDGMWLDVPLRLASWDDVRVGDETLADAVDAKIADHAIASDPHADRAYAAGLVATGTVARATTAGTVTGAQSNTIATAVQPAALAGYLALTNSTRPTIYGLPVFKQADSDPFPGAARMDLWEGALYGMTSVPTLKWGGKALYGDWTMDSQILATRTYSTTNAAAQIAAHAAAADPHADRAYAAGLVATGTVAHAGVEANTNRLGHVQNIGFSYQNNLLYYTAPTGCTGMVFRFYVAGGAVTNIYLWRDNP